jgi:hypothetical protein
MRAFIFSLDAFVAFTLALVAIYSLIFFSSVPSSYYQLMTQGHFLARDILYVLSTSECNLDFGRCEVTGSILDNIVSDSTSQARKEELIRQTAGDMIPAQFGYVFEVSDDQGNTWSEVYDTRDEAGDNHAGQQHKLLVTSQLMTFGYTSHESIETESPYWYTSCGLGGEIITCGEGLNVDPSGAGPQIPQIDARLVRVSIFI